MALIAAGVFALLRGQAKEASSANSFTSQELSEAARADLQVSPLAPEDYVIAGNLDIAGALGVNTITSSADMLIGSRDHAVQLQGSDVSLATTSGGVTNTLHFASASGESKTIVLPNASGVIAVSASGPLMLDANGNLSCPSCLGTTVINSTSTTNVDAPTVATPSATFNDITGDILLQGTANQITITNSVGSKTVTVSLPQDINTNASPVFANMNITQSLQVADVITAGSLTLSAPLAVSSGGTGVSTYSDGQILIGDSSNGGLKVATLTSGTGVVINKGNGAITISAPTAGTCPSCASLSLSNLSGVAINTHLLPGVNNAVDVGSVAAAFRSGYYGTSVHSASFDTVAAGQLNVGMTTASSIMLGANTATAAGKTLTVNGVALFKNSINSTSALQIQDSAGAALLNANTSQGTLSVGAYTPTVVWGQLPPETAWYVLGPGSWGDVVITADFNGDGKADVAAANGLAGSISILLGTGTGTLGAKVDYATGGETTDITSADFNGDGKADVATANSWSNTISVFLGTGTGTFGPKTDYALGVNPQAIVSADFNNDGKADLVTVSNSEASIYLGTGTGTFGSPVSYSTGTLPQSVISADFNNDGKADLATANASSISILLGTGTGTLGAKVDYPTAGTDDPSGSRYDITSADFNGDGVIDLAATNRRVSGSASVFLGTGTGTFGPKTDFALGDSPESIVSADFNNDGKADLAAANSRDSSSSASILLGTGTGTFGPRTNYKLGVNATPSVATADFNRDGIMDIVGSDMGGYVTVALLTVFTGTPVSQASSKLVVNAAANAVGQIIQGTAGQSADLFQVRDELNTTLFSVGATGRVTASSALNVAGVFTATGSVLYKNTTDSTTAFQVQQANSTAVFGIDTSKGRVGIGTAAPANKLSVNTLTTANFTAQVAIGTAATTNKGIVLQGVASQTANLFEAQSSTGVVVASISPAGDLIVASATIKGVLTVGGHLITSGTAPTIAADTAACTTPTMSVVGNDTSGVITITTGTGCSVTGKMATVTFNSSFGAAPRVLMTPTNASSTDLKWYNGSATATAFTIDTATAPNDAATYTFNYWAVQ
jgi:hypothetical protein